MSETDRAVVILGASVAGVTVARTLRSHGFTGPIRLVDREAEEPYDKPQLSKGGVDEPVRLLTYAEAAELDLDLHLGVAATRVDTAARRVELADGTTLDYGSLVIATGVRAETGPWSGPAIHVLRTLADARAVHGSLDRCDHLVVVGGGFIGAEIASVARARGVRVTIIDADPDPAARVVGPVVSECLLAAHREAGVELRLGRRVAALESSGDRVDVRLDDGEQLTADLVVVGIGARLETDWLEGSGLQLDDGVVCDAFGRAAGVEGVFAVGDVARWADPDGTPGRRIEHWSTAQEQARCVARTLVEPQAPQALSEVPMVWSDQHGRTLQILGAVDVAVEPYVVEDGDRLLALWAEGERVVGSAAWGWPRGSLAARRAIARGGSVAEVLDAIAPKVAAR